MKQKEPLVSGPRGDGKSEDSSSLTKENSQSRAVKKGQSAGPENRPSGILPGAEKFFGSNSVEVVRLLLGQMRHLFPGWAASREQIIDIAFGVLGGIEPRDQVEGFLAVQMLGTHNLAMQFLARAALKDQTVDGVNMNVDRATKLLRTFTMQMEALKKHRGKGEQHVIVKHVHVHEGGQAIVGTVSHNSKGGDNGRD